MPTNIERLRRICLALPETHEEITWGSDLNFRVRSKIFCFPGETSMTVKVPKEALIGLLDDPRFALAAYVGRFGWLTMRFVEPIDWAEVDHDTGQLAAPFCPRIINSPFLAGTEPTDSCEQHRF